MTGDEMMDRIVALQHAIGALVDAARLCLGGDASKATPKLLALREEMLAAMRAYQTFKHDTVFDPVIATGNPLRAMTARRLKTSCVMAAETYRLHTTRWPAARIAAEWVEYQAAMATVCKAIEMHLAEERVMVAMLLAGNED